MEDDNTEQVRIDFLDGEIDLCDTFLRAAAVDADHPQSAGIAKGKARHGYDTALAWIDFVKNPRERARLTAKLAGLKERLDKMGA